MESGLINDPFDNYIPGKLCLSEESSKIKVKKRFTSRQSSDF